MCLKSRRKRDAPLCLTRGTVQISRDSAFFGSFGDSAVASMYSRNYYSLCSTEIVISVVCCIFIALTFYNMLHCNFNVILPRSTQIYNTLLYTHCQFPPLLYPQLCTAFSKGGICRAPRKFITHSSTHTVNSRRCTIHRHAPLFSKAEFAAPHGRLIFAVFMVYL